MKEFYETFGFIGVIVAGVIVLFFAWLFLGVYQMVNTQSLCLAKGWAGAEITYNLRPYCITRIDQTDVVVPLEKAEQR